jgi:hypothetical protein
MQGLDLGSLAEIGARRTMSLGAVVEAGLVEAVEPRRPCLSFGENRVVGRKLSGQHALPHRRCQGARSCWTGFDVAGRQASAPDDPGRVAPIVVGDGQPSSAITDSGMSKFA